MCQCLSVEILHLAYPTNDIHHWTGLSVSDKNQYQLSYSRRIDRPGIQQVNPIREWSTPYIISIGNANLRPQFTNSFELNYTRQIKGGNLSFGTFYRKIDDVISRITNEDPANPGVGQILSFTNFSDTDAYGIEFSANFKVNKWFSASLQMNLIYDDDIDIEDRNGNVGPRTQFKQVIGLGITYRLANFKPEKK